MTRDIREASPDGLIIDSIDRLVSEGDVVRLDEVMSLNFDLLGLKVVTQDKKKLGKVVDYTLDAMSFSVYQLIVHFALQSADPSSQDSLLSFPPFFHRHRNRNGKT